METYLWNRTQKEWEATFPSAFIIPIPGVAPLVLLGLAEQAELALS